MARRAFLLGTTSASAAAALGRIPYGGRLALKIPWPVSSLDPHAIGDPTAALFGAAIADTLFALDSRGRPYPTLAAALPERTRAGTRLRLRPHLSTARGKTLDARDVLFSFDRSRRLGGISLLSPFARPTLDRKDGLALLVADADPSALARALTSPLTALLPRGFSRLRPDGTGGFAADLSRRKLILERNLKAARGAAFLQRIQVTQARDLADALRSFEAGEVDVGWLGRGLHRTRPGSVPFNAGRLGWVVLHTGSEAGSWGAPGVAQRLLDGIGPQRLTHLGLHGIPPSSGNSAWGGKPAELLVDGNAPHLVQIAKAVAAHLTRPAHEVRVAARSGRELRRRRGARFSLMLDFVRPVGQAERDTLLALLTAADPTLAHRLPRLASYEPRRIAQTLPLGVVGELRIEGAHIPRVHALEGWELGAIWRR